MNIITRSAALLVAVGVFAGAAVAAEKAPNFSLQDLDGKTVSLSQLKGKVVFLDFWASWCPPCRRSIPAVEALYERYAKDPRVAVMGVNVENKPDATRTFAQKNGMKYRILVDDGAASRAYRVSGIPAFFTIGPDGTMGKKFVGFSGDMQNQWIAEIERLLKTAPPAKK